MTSVSSTVHNSIVRSFLCLHTYSLQEFIPSRYSQVKKKGNNLLFHLLRIITFKIEFFMWIFMDLRPIWVHMYNF